MSLQRTPLFLRLGVKRFTLGALHQGPLPSRLENRDRKDMLTPSDRANILLRSSKSLWRGTATEFRLYHLLAAWSGPRPFRVEGVRILASQDAVRIGHAVQPERLPEPSQGSFSQAETPTSARKQPV